MELRAGFKYNPHRRPLLDIMQGKVSRSVHSVLSEIISLSYLSIYVYFYSLSLPLKPIQTEINN